MRRLIPLLCVLFGTLATARAQLVASGGGPQMGGSVPTAVFTDRVRVMGTWSGTAIDPSGATYPYDMTLAQMGDEVFGIGTMTVDPSNPLFGRPSVRLRGTVRGGGVVRLGMSGILDNVCNESSTKAYDVTLLYDRQSETIVTESVVERLAIGCGQLFQHFTTVRQDRSYAGHNTNIIGTWSGKVDGVYGWIFAPPLMSPPRKSFFNSNGQLKGFMETRPNGPWAEMNLTWNPSTQRIEYVYECVTIYTFAGVVDGNKVSGVEKYTGTSDEDFFGVFVHTLDPVFVEPTAPFAAFCPWTD